MLKHSGNFLGRRVSWGGLVLAGAVTACGANESSDTQGVQATGGGFATGGALATGGGSATGGVGAATGGAATGTGGAATGTGGSAAITCTPVTSTSLLSFDDYNGTDLSFLVAGSASSGVYMGPWELTDERDTANEDPAPTYALEMVAGIGDTGYALHVSDEEAKRWGGGAGFWTSGCVDAATYSGIRLQVRGTAPTGVVRLEVGTRDTDPPPAPPEMGVGTCMGADCADAWTELALGTDPEEWTQIDLPWSAFTPGVGSEGVAAPLSGFGITGLVFSVSLTYGETGPIPAPYELTIDSIGFY